MMMTQGRQDILRVTVAVERAYSPQILQYPSRTTFFD